MTRLQTLALLGMALGTAAAAQNAAKPIARSDYVKTVDAHFNNADTNHDGFVSKAELDAQLQRDLQTAKNNVDAKLRDGFKHLDTNHDGVLSMAEFLASAPAIKTTETPEQMMARLDANHDGKISADEFRSPELAKFNKVDANHDGVVTPQEIQAARGK